MNVTEMILILAVVVIWLAFRFKPRPAAQTRQTRLSNITTASFMFRWLIYLGLLVQVYVLLAYFFGWPGHERCQFRVAPGHLYASPADMPAQIEALWLVKVGLATWALVVLSCLLHLYEKGIFFTAKNVNYIRFFGYYLIINWVVDYQLQGLLRMELTTTSLLTGLLVIFIAWIMDEGRKIQEEQALTV